MHGLLSKKLQHKKKNVTFVQDLSNELIPILGQVKFAIVIHNLFTLQECRDWIDVTEKKGYDNALIHGPDGGEVLRRDVRNSGRCIVDNRELANDWFERILRALEGSVVKDRFLDGRWVENRNHHRGFVDTTTTTTGKRRILKAVGLNERFRFLRYRPGQYFGSHRDNVFTRDGNTSQQCVGQESHLTFLLYLNDKMVGGQTRIHGGGRYLDVVPETGSVFIFDPDILHEAVAVESGSKYCCRTDVMFEVKDVPVEQEPVEQLLCENVWDSQVKSFDSIR